MSANWLAIFDYDFEWSIHVHRVIYRAGKWFFCFYSWAKPRKHKLRNELCGFSPANLFTSLPKRCETQPNSNRLFNSMWPMLRHLHVAFSFNFVFFSLQNWIKTLFFRSFPNLRWNDRQNVWLHEFHPVNCTQSRNWNHEHNCSDRVGSL